MKACRVLTPALEEIVQDRCACRKFARNGSRLEEREAFDRRQTPTTPYFSPSVGGKMLLYIVKKRKEKKKEKKNLSRFRRIMFWKETL